MNSTLAILAVLDGISYAALVFLVSVGLSLIFGVLRVVNVAHGSFYAFGAYLAATFSLAIAPLSPWLTYPSLLAASIVIGAVCGGFIERFLLRPLYGRDDVLQLLITFAAFMVMDNLQRLIWGVQPIFAAEPLKLLPHIVVFGVNYTSYQVIVLPGVALATLFGLRYFLRKTLAGAVILAVTEDREASTAIGIDAQRVYSITFIIGASLAALGGALASPSTSLVLGIVVLLQAGQVSFGHAVFFATGAYTAAFWGKYIGTGDILLYVALAGITSTLFGLIVGLFVVRYREIFFGMLNLAFSMVLWSLLEKMFHYTNGADGIRVARPGLFGFSFTPETFQYVILYVSLLVAIAAFYGVQRYLDSPLGHMLRAMKSNETRLEYLGMSARRVLLIGYVISALLGG